MKPVVVRFVAPAGGVTTPPFVYLRSNFWGQELSDADMALRVHHVLLRKDAVGDHEMLDEGVKAAHGYDDPSEGR
jgi:hypothetical protein